jgi:hypothetical protein
MSILRESSHGTGRVSVFACGTAARRVSVRCVLCACHVHVGRRLETECGPGESRVSMCASRRSHVNLCLCCLYSLCVCALDMGQIAVLLCAMTRACVTVRDSFSTWHMGLSDSQESLFPATHEERSAEAGPGAGETESPDRESTRAHELACGPTLHSPSRVPVTADQHPTVPLPRAE